MQNIPHRRYNPLRGQWVLVSPHRTQRPWQGEVATAQIPTPNAYDPNCYLCPGNVRAGGHHNPRYEGIFVFDNDFAALLPEDSSPSAASQHPLHRAEPERGLCRVVCFHPNHSLTLAQMETGDITRVVQAWTEQYIELGALDWIQHVQIFENRGAMMGASNPHPHGQIWATEHIPDEPLAEGSMQGEYLRAHGRCLLCDTVQLELQQAERIICANEEFVALVPFWAVWPFEALVLSRRHCGALSSMDMGQHAALSEILQRLTRRYDNLFATSFPYTMGQHAAPTDGQIHPEWHFHAHFYPPLLRSALVRKYMVGFEMLANPQRDITPEQAAARLREAGEALRLPGCV